MEHFGLSFKQAEDYYNADAWGLMVEISKKNHDLYRLLFGCYPDNAMSNF